MARVHRHPSEMEPINAPVIRDIFAIAVKLVIALAVCIVLTLDKPRFS